MLEEVIRDKIDQLFQQKEQGKIKGLDAKFVSDLHTKSVATKKAHYPMPLDLKTLTKIQSLHQKHCH